MEVVKAMGKLIQRGTSLPMVKGLELNEPNQGSMFIQWFYSCTHLPQRSLALLKEKPFSKAIRRRVLCFALKLDIFLKTCEPIQPGNTWSCSSSWGISWLCFFNITSQLSVLFCTGALLQINFQAGEIPRQMILWWNNWIVQGPIGPTESSAHVQTITHGNVKQS